MSASGPKQIWASALHILGVERTSRSWTMVQLDDCIDKLESFDRNASELNGEELKFQIL